jgi:protein-S-isoprenylcysteine O-methyltransferase Ste14
MALVAGVTLWLAAPTPLTLGVGLCLACCGELMRIWAIGYTGESTRKQSLDAPRLVTGGPYSLIRNPLYLGNLLNAAGVLSASYASYALGVGVILFALVVALYQMIIDLEQKFLLEQFGEEYRDYCRRVPSLWPRHLRVSRAGGSLSWQKGLRFEWTSLFWWVVVWSWLAFRL